MQQRELVVELSSLLHGAGSAGAGMKRLTRGLGRLRAVHDAVQRGAESWRWPHLLLPDEVALDAVVATARALAARAPVLAVAGQPGALAALRGVLAALAPDAAVRWVGAPDPALTAIVDREDVGWIVLEGPAWADALAEEAVGRGRAVAIAGEGDHEAPPEGWWVSDPTAGDGRFGALGMASLLAAAACGVDVRALLDGARAMAASCERSALFENPAYSLAMALLVVAKDAGAATPVHLVPTTRLQPFAEWAGRTWGAVLCGAQVVEGVRQRLGGQGLGGTLGDEELHQSLLAGTRDKAVVLWDVEGVAPFAAASRAFRAVWAREQLPLVRVRLPGLDARTLGASVTLASHAALVASLWMDLDPLRLEAVEAWYAALERAGPPVDEDARTA